MMKAEGISRELAPNGLPLERQENAGKSDEDFRALLETKSSMATEFSAFQEVQPSPMCSSGCSDSSSPAFMDSGKAAVAYHNNAVLYQPGQSEGVLARPDSALSINLQKGDPSAFEVEKTPLQPPNGSSPPPESTGGLSHVLSEIKDFFVRIFSPRGSSSNEPEPMVREKVAESGANNPVSGFFRWLGTLLSFGVRRHEENQESAKVSKDALAEAPHEGVDSIERDSPANASSRQNLPTERGDFTGSEVGKTTKSFALKVPARIQEAIQEAARKYDLSADLIAAVIRVESNFDPSAVSKEGAGGLMQLMPSTARALKVRNRFDIQQNIDGGSRYLKSLLERFGGQVELALAAYNVGPEAVEKYEGVPPYRHTRHYVKKVLAYC
jgi:hypothetical protein